MTYQQTIEYLYNATPQFQRIGAAAYKPGLDTARALAGAFGNPQDKFPTIHVAGTNGKGSTCHTLAAVLQSAGYKVGLYTSPHLLDFRERIRINGEMISEPSVVDFVERYIGSGLGLSPSFFELTTIMAFDHFARNEVDIAVIETGLGGRLDTTNIITPLLSVITNISYDHMAQLGDTLLSIAGEKAGIIKPGIPVVVGNGGHDEIRELFLSRAHSCCSELTFADIVRRYATAEAVDGGIRYTATAFGDFTGALSGDCQRENTATIICALERLRSAGLRFTDADVARGFAEVESLTGLAGRWMKLSDKPLTICDTGHNEGGWKWIGDTLKRRSGNLHMVIGFVNDKDVSHILRLMPADAEYYFTRASVPRAMEAERLAALAADAGLHGSVYPDVASAYTAACSAASRHDTLNIAQTRNTDSGNAASKQSSDMVFVGGSTFIVADLLDFARRRSCGS